MTPDEKVQEIASSLEDDIPVDLDRSTAGKSTFRVDKEGLMDSLGTVLSQEMKKFNRLLRLARKTVKELQKAIKGLVVMSSDLEGMYDDLMYNNIPRLWKQVNYDSLKAVSFVYGRFENTHKIHENMAKTRSAQLFSTVFVFLSTRLFDRRTANTCQTVQCCHQCARFFVCDCERGTK